MQKSRKILLLFILTINLTFLYSQPDIDLSSIQTKKSVADNDSVLYLNDYLDLGGPVNGLASAKVGSSISFLGDINGDGFDDWALPLSVGDTITGERVRVINIYLGSSARRESETPADLVFWGEAYKVFGYLAKGVGDINNDGFEDMAAFSDSGVELYLGGNPFDVESDGLFKKLDIHEGFTNFASGAGDVNNDGYDDLLLSVSTQIWGPDTAHVYLYYGGEIIDEVPDVIFKGRLNPPSDYNPGAHNYGNATSAGDVNKDGFDDIIISSSRGGELYLGATNMDIEMDVLFNDFRGAGIGTGPGVMTAGDVNGDGYSDVLLTANIANTKAFICYGGDVIDSITDVEIPIWTEETYYGFSSVGAGDINKDGFDDILLGISSDWPVDTGQARIFYGAAVMDSIADVLFYGTQKATSFGYSVAGGGDFDGDGYNDFLIGDNGNIANFIQADDAGSISLFYGGESIDGAHDAIFSGVADYEGFGSSVANAGDVNNDGYLDLLVGAANHWENYYEGRAYLYFGGETFDKNPDLQFTTNEDYNGESRFFGREVGSAGDINGDGFSDIYIAETYKISIFLGGQAMDTISDYEISVPKSHYSFSPLGDVNDDGLDDVIYCDPGAGTGGTALLYLGGDNFLTSPTLTFTGNSDDNLGANSGSAGDINNDGIVDFFFSVPGDDATYGSDTGSVYVYLGGKTVSNTPYLVLPEYSEVYLGSKDVSCGGDINNDGYSDIIVSDNLYSSVSSSKAGRIYIYYGGETMDNIVDVVLTGDTAEVQLGQKVMIIPDLNHDGFDELLMNRGNWLSGTESISIFYGGNPMDSIADITFPYTATHYDFYAYLDEKDSISYLLIGHSGNYAVGPQSGRVFIYSNFENELIGTSTNNVIQTENFHLNNYPNPFSESTIISYHLPESCYVDISIYNLYGQKVGSLSSGYKLAGLNSESFKAEGLPEGIYLYIIRAGENVEAGKMLIKGD